VIMSVLSFIYDIYAVVNCFCGLWLVLIANDLFRYSTALSTTYNCISLNPKDVSFIQALFVTQYENWQ